MLYEGDNNYVLQLDDDRVVQLARGRVVGSITDSKLPTPHGVHERDRAGRRDEPGRGDEIVLSFSEPIDPSSLLSGWNGAAVEVTLHLEAPKDGRPATLTVLDRSGRRAVALGTVRFLQARLIKRRHAAARMLLEAKDVVIRLGEALPLQWPQSEPRWTPSSRARDAVGNAVLAREVHE